MECVNGEIHLSDAATLTLPTDATVTTKPKKVCWLCRSTDWLDVDYLRQEPKRMVVCQGCGLVTFSRFHDTHEYESYYDHSYRESQGVTVHNMLTTNRKTGYHQMFLGPWLDQHKGCRVGEIGSSIGYFLRWCRDKYNCHIVCGSELTSSHRRYAKHAFKLDLSKDFDYTNTYDLIACYHTLEHVPDPVEMLTKLRGCLSDDGVLYLSFPVWMDELMRFGGGPFVSFDEHFHPDHINAWSRWHVKEMFRLTGWKIIQENTQSYGLTVLCQKTTPEPIRVTDAPSARQVETQLSDMQRASVAFKKGQFAEAIRLYPRFVDAYLAEAVNHVKHLDRQLELFNAGEALCPNTRVWSFARGRVWYQWGRLDEAEQAFRHGLEMKPHDDDILVLLAIISMKRGLLLLPRDQATAMPHFEKAIGLFNLVIGLNPTQFANCFNMIAHMFSVVPLPDEAEHFVAPHALGAPHIDLPTERTVAAEG